MTPEDPQIVIDDYIRSGQSKCPWAKGALLIYADRSHNNLIATLEDMLSLFRARRGAAAIIISHYTHKTFLEFETWALGTFLVLDQCARVCDGWSPTVAVRQMLETERVLRDPESTIRPHIGLDGHAIITIAMGPLYPQIHPRYMPRSCLVLTWLADISDAQANCRAVDKVHAAMELAHNGVVYDGNEIVLPLP